MLTEIYIEALLVDEELGGSDLGVVELWTHSRQSGGDSLVDYCASTRELFQ